MDETALIAETNSLLKQMLEMNAAQKAEAERAQAEFEKSMQSMRFSMKAEGGEPETSDEADDSPAKWERRMKEVQERARKNIEELQAKDQQFKAELLRELAVQSELLNRIAERLGQ